MSDAFIQYVPKDPHWQPTPAVAERALAEAWRLFPEADEVTTEFHDTVQLFHPFECWDGVTCSACQADLETWWYDALGGIAATDFTDFSVVTPCCGTATNLRDLSYFNAPGFGRFVLSIMNPGNEPTLEMDLEIEATLGAPLDEVRVYF